MKRQKNESRGFCGVIKFKISGHKNFVEVRSVNFTSNGLREWKKISISVKGVCNAGVPVSAATDSVVIASYDDTSIHIFILHHILIFPISEIDIRDLESFRSTLLP